MKEINKSFKTKTKTKTVTTTTITTTTTNTDSRSSWKNACGTRLNKLSESKTNRGIRKEIKTTLTQIDTHAHTYTYTNKHELHLLSPLK